MQLSNSTNLAGVNLISVADTPEDLIIAISYAWIEENRGTYLRLFGNCNNLAGDSLSRKVDEVLREEVRVISNEILNDSKSYHRWRQWIGWINFLRLIQANYSPMSLFQNKPELS